MPGNILVTGASSGIGRELARQLAHAGGWTVLVTARRRDRLEGLAAECPPGSVRFLDGDLQDPGFRARLWEWAEGHPGGVEVLINNAGLGDYHVFERQSFDAMRLMVEVNLMALLDLTRLAIPAMRGRGRGQIVEVSSVLGFIGLPYSSVYVATKHAVNGLVKSLRCELHGTGVRVWAACPGPTESEFHTAAIGGPLSGHHGESTARIVRNILKGLDRNRAFVIPSLMASTFVALGTWLPGPYRWFMSRWGRRYFAKQNLAHRQGDLP